MKAQISKRINIFYSVIGTVLFLASGVMIIEYRERGRRGRTHDIGMTKGVVALINGLIFLMDAIFTFRLKK